jgi:hypothetical protein
MAIDETPSSFFAPWPDRLRHSAIILLAAGLGLTALVTLGHLPLWHAAAVFVLIASGALVPWQLHDPEASRDERLRGIGSQRSDKHRKFTLYFSLLLGFDGETVSQGTGPTTKQSSANHGDLLHHYSKAARTTGRLPKRRKSSFPRRSKRI